MSKWVKYPENKPSHSKASKWYAVKFDDGTQHEGCWFLDGWYCFGEWYRIV